MDTEEQTKKIVISTLVNSFMLLSSLESYYSSYWRLFWRY
jgi:hypothetical protein